MTEILFIRHGETDCNKKRLYYIVQDDRDETMGFVTDMIFSSKLIFYT